MLERTEPPDKSRSEPLVLFRSGPKRQTPSPSPVVGFLPVFDPNGKVGARKGVPEGFGRCAPTGQ